MLNLGLAHDADNIQSAVHPLDLVETESTCQGLMLGSRMFSCACYRLLDRMSSTRVRWGGSCFGLRGTCKKWGLLTGPSPPTQYPSAASHRPQRSLSGCQQCTPRKSLPTCLDHGGIKKIRGKDDLSNTKVIETRPYIQSQEARARLLVPARAKMPPLVRSDSFQDIDFTLRRQFGKQEFRYLALGESYQTKNTLLTPVQTLSARDYSRGTPRQRCLCPGRHIVWQELVLPAPRGHRPRKYACPWISF